MPPHFQSTLLSCSIRLRAPPVGGINQIALHVSVRSMSGDPTKERLSNTSLLPQLYLPVNEVGSVLNRLKDLEEVVFVLHQLQNSEFSLT